MWKKVIFAIALIIVFAIGIESFINNKNKKENKNVNIVKEENEISSTYVTDGCIDEWEDYAKSREEEIKETSQNFNDENKHYILRCEDNVIKVYYINEHAEEILYKTTELPIEYLSEEDQQRLKNGIDIYGIEELNKLIEDFE